MDVGVVIDNYEIVEHIGRGGMADVWSARDKKLSRMVAIKTIAHGLSADADPVGLFKQEAQTIAQMEHPHILPIYDFGEHEGQLFIIMRYVAGGSLEDLLRRGPISLNDALRMGQSIAQALDYAHASKVVHLDLKPPNVLLDSHHSPYLADFGLATVLDPEGKAANPGSGTLLYMAPEQLTAEVIDYRADLYSFAIVMFHMLTGQLPFDGSAPLAIKQIQYRDELPALEDLNPSVPSAFTTVLRQATALDPADRQDTLMQVVDELQAAYNEALGLSLTGDLGSVRMADVDGGDFYDADALAQYAGLGSELLEAVDIYSRARHAWAGGNGRFLLGVTNYLVMNGYYMNAELHGLELDEAGRQMLLRGAIEYDQSVAYWWGQLGAESRRWVCLHALRSGNAPARVRALYRLETLPDAEKPVIPKLVAQMLQIETNEEARIAALQVLGTRHTLMRRTPNYNLETQYRGRLLTTLTRISIDRSADSAPDRREWQSVVYSPEIDHLLADIAMDTGMPRVAEFGARVVGRIRSETAVRHIAKSQREGKRGALRALAIIRDQTPSLPPAVGTAARVYAWTSNTVRRLFDRPLSLVMRFAVAWLAGWLAMGFTIYMTFRTENLFSLQRWLNTLAMGLVYGLVIAILVIVVDEFSTRLRGFWPWWVRGLLSAAFGLWFGVLIWTFYVQLYLEALYVWNTIHLAGFMLMLGFWLASMLRLRGVIAIPLTALLIYVPINVGYHLGFAYTYRSMEIDFGLLRFGYSEGPLIDLRPLGDMIVNPLTNAYGTSVFRLNLLADGQPDLGIGQFVIAYDDPDHVVSIGLTFAVLIALGGHLPRLVKDIRALVHVVRGWVTAPAKAEPTAQGPLVPAPVPGVAHRMDPGALNTEMDVNRQALGPDTQQSYETEFDLNLGRDRPDETARVRSTVEMEIPDDLGIKRGDASESRHVNMGTGIRIEPKSANTEMDVQQGLQRAERGEDAPVSNPSQSRHVSMGTGIRIEPKSANTEMDVQQGLQRAEEDDDAPAANPSQSRHVSMGTGIRIEPKSAQTETDAQSGPTRDADEDEAGDNDDSH